MDHKKAFEGSPLDVSRLGELLESYRPWCRVFVRQFLFGRLGRRLDESDVIQSAWVDVIRNAEKFSGKTEAEFFAWLKKILESHLNNALRNNMAGKRDFRREAEFSCDMDSASLNWWDAIDPNSSPSNRLVRGEAALKLANAIDSLPDNQRQAIELRHIAGKRLSEVSELMDKTPDAIVSLLRRAMVKLASRLTDE